MFLRVSRVGVVAVQPPQATLPLATRSDRGSSGGRADRTSNGKFRRISGRSAYVCFRTIADIPRPFAVPNRC